MFVVVVTPGTNWAVAVLARAQSETSARRAGRMGCLLRVEGEGNDGQAPFRERGRYAPLPAGQSGRGGGRAAGLPPRPTPERQRQIPLATKGRPRGPWDAGVPVPDDDSRRPRPADAIGMASGLRRF